MRDPRRHPEARVPLPTRVPLAQLQQVADLVAPVVAAELGPLPAGPHRLELARPGLQLMGGHARDYKRGGGAEVRPHVLRHALAAARRTGRPMADFRADVARTSPERLVVFVPLSAGNLGWSRQEEYDLFRARANELLRSIGSARTNTRPGACRPGHGHAERGGLR